MLHYAVRGVMHESAIKCDVDPGRLSFLHAVRLIRRKCLAAGAIAPSRQDAWHQAILTEILDERLPPDGIAATRRASSAK